MVIIRRTEEKDAAVLSVLAKKTFYDTFVGTAPEEDMQAALADWYAPQRFIDRIQDKAFTTLLAMDGDKAAGYATFWAHQPDFLLPDHENGLELLNLYIDTPWHGTGLAQRLMQEYYKTAEEKSLNYLWLGVWEHNYRAQKFYAKEGFTNTGHTHPFPIHNTPQTDQWWSKRL